MSESKLLSLRALVVEDDPGMRKLLIQLLPLTQLAEFQFTEAANGAEAWDKYRQSPPEIVFVDMHMPKLSGIDFVRKVRAAENAVDAMRSVANSGRVPIVLVTGEARMGAIEEALDKAGADVYITKPFTITSLRNRLQELIGTMAVTVAEQPKVERTGFLSRLLGNGAR